MTWQKNFKFDPIQALLKSENEAIIYLTKLKLLERDTEPIEWLWDLPEVRLILQRQSRTGAWLPTGRKRLVPAINPGLVDTWKQFRFLIDCYEFDVRHPAIAEAVDFLFSCTTREGDFRGFLANQYTPYYTGAITYLVIKAGVLHDTRIEKAMRWLLDMRQNDGGWVIGSPGMVGAPNLSRQEINDLTSNPKRRTQRSFDRTKPFSAAGTGMVLRAFAVHPKYQRSKEARRAAGLLMSKFFKKDNWTSYQHPDNWIRFDFPFWWTNIVSALDTLSELGYSANVNEIDEALNWLLTHQESDGLWKTSYSSIHRASPNSETRLWITYAICRIFKRFA